MKPARSKEAGQKSTGCANGASPLATEKLKARAGNGKAEDFGGMLSGFLGDSPGYRKKANVIQFRLRSGSSWWPNAAGKPR